MKYLLLIVLTSIAGIAFTQSTVLSKIPKTGAAIKAFIPADYDTLGTAQGDLDKDGLADVVMVLGHRYEHLETSELEKIDSIPSRLLLVLFRKGDEYSLKAASASAVMCEGCGGIFGDPFAGVEIIKGILVLNHYGGSAWRWSYTHKFRFQQDAFYLIGRTSHSYWNVKMCDKLGDFAGTNYEDINFLTGGFEKKEITEQCKLLQNKKGKRPKKALVSLDTFDIEKEGM